MVEVLELNNVMSHVLYVLLDHLVIRICSSVVFSLRFQTLRLIPVPRRTLIVFLVWVPRPGRNVASCYKRVPCNAWTPYKESCLKDWWGWFSIDSWPPSLCWKRFTWRIIPASKWLVTPMYKPFRPFGRGTTLLRGLITMVIYHLLTGMILQVGDRRDQRALQQEVLHFFGRLHRWFLVTPTCCSPTFGLWTFADVVYIS